MIAQHDRRRIVGKHRGRQHIDVMILKGHRRHIAHVQMQIVFRKLFLRLPGNPLPVLDTGRIIVTGTQLDISGHKDVRLPGLGRMETVHGGPSFFISYHILIGRVRFQPGHRGCVHVISVVIGRIYRGICQKSRHRESVAAHLGSLGYHCLARVAAETIPGQHHLRLIAAHAQHHIAYIGICLRRGISGRLRHAVRGLCLRLCGRFFCICCILCICSVAFALRLLLVRNKYLVIRTFLLASNSCEGKHHEQAQEK